MGSCLSVQKLKISFRSTEENRLSIPSPVKQTSSETAGAGDRAVTDFPIKTTLFRPVSKEEAFFDSQPWMDSDCEEDFVSVRGGKRNHYSTTIFIPSNMYDTFVADFTPSCGSTPVHPSCINGGIIRLREFLVEEGTPDSVTMESSSPDKKKRLSDLFKESLRMEHHPDEENVDAIKGTNSIHQPNGFHIAEEKSTHRCLPGFLSTNSFSQRKKNNKNG